MATIADLGLNRWLVEQCATVGISKATPIQRHCVPKILQGNDCIGCAKTGSGKTAAFALPVLQRLCEDPYGIFALVITPTRELAYQIGEQFIVLGKPINIRVAIVTGGRDIVEQGSKVSQRPHILICTPGRLADIIDNSRFLSLARIKFLILDEADRLMEDDFGSQLATIFSVIPSDRQTLLFSATMTDALAAARSLSARKPFCWIETAPIKTVDELDQRFVLLPAHVKDAYLVHILSKYLEDHQNSCVMIFTITCKYCQVLTMMLSRCGISCVALHSMISQRQRLSALARFKSNQVKVLVATDVASRGLDIPTVDLVINHNISTRPKDYVHRVGRTARAGRSGLAISLVTQFDQKLATAVEEHINSKLVEFPVDDREVAKIAMEIAVTRREAEIRLDESDFGQKKEINKEKKLRVEDISEENHKKKRNKKTGRVKSKRKKMTRN